MKRRLFALALGTVGLPVEAWAGRPLVIDDAATVPRGSAEFEAGFYFENRSDLRHYDAPFGVTGGLTRTLEIGLAFGGRLDEREEVFGDSRTHSGIGDLILGAKWNPLSETNGWASHAFTFGIKFPTADPDSGLGSGENDYDLTYIASKNIADRFSVHLNAGYTFVGDSVDDRNDDIVHSGVAIGYGATATMELVAEIFSDLPVRRAQDAVLTIKGGLRWNCCGSLVLDAAMGTGIHGSAPDVLATVGLTWVFGLLQDQTEGD